MDGISDSMDMNLSKLLEILKDKAYNPIRKRQTTQYKNGQILEKKFHKKGNLNGQ